MTHFEQDSRGILNKDLDEAKNAIEQISERKKKKNFYELLCLVEKVDKNKYALFVKKLVSVLEELTNGPVSVEEREDLKIAYPIKNLVEGRYLLINFSSFSKTIGEIKKSLLDNPNRSKLINRFKLINLSSERRMMAKIKSRKKNETNEENSEV